MTSREQQAAAIIANAAEHCVCECCSSILRMRNSATCPNCNGYRLNSDVEFVIATARFLAMTERSSVTRSDME